MFCTVKLPYRCCFIQQFLDFPTRVIGRYLISRSHEFVFFPHLVYMHVAEGQKAQTNVKDYREKKEERGSPNIYCITLNHRRQHEGRGQRKWQRGKRTISRQKVKTKGNDKRLVKESKTRKET